MLTHAHSQIVQASPGCSSGIHHRNALTERAWKDSVQGLGNHFHIFITLSSSFHCFKINEFNNLFPVGLLAQSVRALHQYRRGQGFKSDKSLNFFKLSFRNCKKLQQHNKLLYLFFYTNYIVSPLAIPFLYFCFCYGMISWLQLHQGT